MDRRHYDREVFNKMYDIIELIYILNRLSNNSQIDDHSKQYLISMLNDVESVKSNFDKYRYQEPYSGRQYISSKHCDSCNYKTGDTLADKIIFFLKSLNNE